MILRLLTAQVSARRLGLVLRTPTLMSTPNRSGRKINLSCTGCRWINSPKPTYSLLLSRLSAWRSGIWSASTRGSL